MSTEQVSEEVRFVSTEQVSAGQAPPGEAARAYLAALAWDGVRRVDTWLAPSAPPEGAALRELVAARLWLLSAAARALRPGCQVGGLLALAGERGSGRTLLVEALAGPLGGFSCFGSGQLGSRGSMLHLRDLWLAELDLPPPATRARAEVLDFAARREDMRSSWAGRASALEAGAAARRQAAAVALARADELADRLGDLKLVLELVRATKEP